MLRDDSSAIFSFTGSMISRDMCTLSLLIVTVYAESIYL